MTACSSDGSGQGGTNPGHQPVLAISAGGRERLQKQPKGRTTTKGDDHQIMVTVLLLEGMCEALTGAGRSSVFFKSLVTLFARRSLQIGILL